MVVFFLWVFFSLGGGGGGYKTVVGRGGAGEVLSLQKVKAMLKPEVGWGKKSFHPLKGGGSANSFTLSH